MSRLIRTFSAILIATASLVVSVSAQEVYIATGSTGVAGTLYRFDASTGQQLSSVPITNVNGNGAIGVTGLAFNPITNVLYGVTVNKTAAGGNTVSGALLTINPLTGKATVLGALVLGSSFSQVGDIEFAPDGTLYGWEARDPNSLATITISGSQAGRMTTVGLSGVAVNIGGGLALSPTDPNKFYVTTASPDGFGTLDSVNRQTGALTVGPVLTGAPKTNSINALSFFENTLYGINSSGDPEEVNELGQPDENYLITINLVNGAVNDVFRIPFNNVDAIAFNPIPEPSTIALLITAAAGAAGLRFYRRRK